MYINVVDGLRASTALAFLTVLYYVITVKKKKKGKKRIPLVRTTQYEATTTRTADAAPKAARAKRFFFLLLFSSVFGARAARCNGRSPMHSCSKFRIFKTFRAPSRPYVLQSIICTRVFFLFFVFSSRRHTHTTKRRRNGDVFTGEGGFLPLNLRRTPSVSNFPNNQRFLKKIEFTVIENRTKI